MSQPGWYPDPSGQPRRLRYWDGRQWSQQTRPADGAAPGPGPAPAPPGTGDRRRGNRALVPILIGVAAVIVVVAIIAGSGMFSSGPRDITDNPPTVTVSGWDDGASPSPTPPPSPTPSPTPTPTPESSPSPTETVQSETVPPDPIPCPRSTGPASDGDTVGGRITGGNLSFPEIGGDWRRGTSQVALVMSFGYDVDGETLSVTSGWFVQMTVGALDGADGFTDPERSADIIVSCIATSGFMSGATNRTDLHSKPITIDGREGWTIRAEVPVSGREDQGVRGSIFDVIVIDSGVENGLGFFVAESTIDFEDQYAVRDRTIAALRIAD